MAKNSNENIDMLLSKALCEKKVPAQQVHDRIMKLWDMNDACAKRQHKPKLIVKPVIAFMCIIIVSICGTSVYAMINERRRAGEVLEDIWTAEEQVSKEQIEQNIDNYEENFEIIYENNENENINIEPVMFVSDSFVSYLVFKVSGTAGYRLPDDMVMQGFSHFKTNDEFVRAYSYYFLREEENAKYYAVFLNNIISSGEVTVTCEKINFYHGKYEEENGCIDYYDSEAGKINEHPYSVTIKSNVKTDHVTINAEGVDYHIYALGVSGDFRIYKAIESATYDREKDEYHYDNAVVMMKDGSEVAIKVSYAANQDITSCYFDYPININEVKGLRIGDKEYLTD